MFHIEDLYMQYKKDLYIYLMSLTHNHTLSEDLLSETFVKAIKSLPTFEEKSTVKTWLFGIARNTWLQHIRSDKKTVEYDDLLGLYVNDSMEDFIITKEFIERIKHLLSTKDDRTKLVLSMRVEGYPYSFIAQKLKISESTARVIEFRTRQWLKSILEKEELM